MPSTASNVRDTMEKVWEELKKIEDQAQIIKTSAQEKAKEITVQAKQDADKLISNSKKIAAEEAQKLYTKVTAEANAAREAQLNQNRGIVEKLRVEAEKNVDKAVDVIFERVLEDQR